MNALRFPRRGYRRKTGYGLTYRSSCGRFAIYKSHQAAGVEIRPVRWLAIEILETGERIISKHRKRAAAERACEKAARRVEA